MQAVWAIGLMTGTVLDGNVDIAMIRTDGHSILEFGPWALKPYPDEVNQVIARAVEAARAWRFQGDEPEAFAVTEAALSAAQADAVAGFLRENGLRPSDIAVVGLHGQTVLHRAPTPVKAGDTRQLGDGHLMARRLGIDVAFDFRGADVRAGGQGAPLAAVYHAALMEFAGLAPPAAVLNLGGVGNLTVWNGGDDLLAFDTGPANGPVNDWVGRHTGARMDVNGELAARGAVDEDRLASLLQHPYFDQVPPKSLDRYDFTTHMADGLSLEDGAALLTAFSAACVGRGLELVPERPARLVVCGGGRHNPRLLSEIERRATVSVVRAEDVGWRGDAVEAECFAFLAVRALRGLPYSFPTTTGVPEAMSGARIARFG